MQTTKMSSKGQVIIPKALRSRYSWGTGQKLDVIDTGDGILLKPSRTFQKTRLDEVAGMLKYSGKPVSLEEMEAAIRKGALERKKMISADTNVIVRLLTGDDPTQLKRAEALFSREEVLVTPTVLLECEWVLRYAYRFKPTEIVRAFESLLGLPNVYPQEPVVILTAIEWHKQGLDFVDALHLAKSQEAEAFVTFDKKLVRAASRASNIPVKEP